ncbi:MAG: lipopolysaccharide biosynthesis protein [Phycisphaeraceae bacterium]|nr:lipopolysaccharide biosynthesis protein [Phycisphaeraceae bacterium]
MAQAPANSSNAGTLNGDGQVAPTSGVDPKAKYFATEHLKDDLRGRSVRSGLITVISSSSSFVIGMVATAILARLLDPEDFGLIGMVSVIVGFIVLFKDMGLSMATVQQEKVTHDQVSTLFWINVLISSVIAVIAAVISPAIAWFYDEPRLLWIGLISAPGQIISGLIIQHQALLRRQMRFGTLSAIDITSQVGSIAIAITLAWQGWGYWALVVQTLSMGIINMSLVWIVTGWIPGKMVRGSGVRPMLKFGGFLTGFNLTNHFARNLDNILIGKFAGSVELGLYQKAYTLLMLPINQINAPITSVAIPALSRLQKDPEAFRRYYQRAIGLLVIVGMPVIAFAAAAAKPIILILLGEKWLDAVAIFLALSPAAFIGTFNVATGWVYTSMGTTHRQFRYGIVAAIFTCIGFAIGAHWGPIGVAWSLSINFVLIRYPAVAYCFAGTPLKPRHLGVVLWRPALAAIATGIGTWYAWDRWMGQWNLFAAFFAMAGLFAIMYLLCWLILPGGRQHLIDTVKLLKEIKSKRK